MVDFEKRNLQFGHGEWKLMTRNGGNRWVFSLAPTARGYTKLGEYFAKIWHFDIDVLAVRADFGDISGVWNVATSTR